jgi:hypothetical protein
MNKPLIPIRPSLLNRFPSRRDLLRGLASTGLALPIARLPESAAKRRRRRKNKKKVRRNAFGCVNVGSFCKNSGQCCSGICTGKQDKKTCQAHNASTCTGTSGCGGDEFVRCTTDTGADGTCNVTTGNASYCATAGVCFDCSTDAECEPVCGAGAACTVCAECVPQGIQTACASANEFGCFPV